MIKGVSVVVVVIVFVLLLSDSVGDVVPEIRWKLKKQIKYILNV